MDPLSITASVVGLLMAAGKVFSLLDSVASMKECPAVIHDSRSEVRQAELALRSMQRYLQRLELLDPRRAALIQIDELRVTLADAMLAFSDFESLLQSLSSLTRFNAVTNWARYSKLIGEHLAKIQRYKASLTLMLGILHCESDLEASKSHARLQALVEEVLSENKKLTQLLHQSEDSFDARSTFTRRIDEDSTTLYQSALDDDNGDALTIRRVSRSNTVRRSIDFSDAGNMRFAFENILEQSWVYRRNERNECDCSFVSSVQRSYAWSIFSGYSLADISILSVIAMPLTLRELTNGSYYTFQEGDNQVLESMCGQSNSTAPASIASEDRHDDGTAGKDEDDNVSDVSSEASISSVIKHDSVYALHTFVATVEGQVDAAKGEVMILLDDSNSYWWLVRLSNDGRIGYLPAEFVETPVERLARFNKHKNTELDEALRLAPGGLSKGNTKGKRRQKTVTFATTVSHIGWSEGDFHADQDDIDDLSEPESTATKDPHREEQQSSAGDDISNMTVAVVSELPNPQAQEAAIKYVTSEIEQFSTSTPEPILESSASGGLDPFLADDTAQTRKMTLTPSLLQDYDGSSNNSAVEEVDNFFKFALLLEKNKDGNSSRKPRKIRSLLSWKERRKSLEVAL